MTGIVIWTIIRGLTWLRGYNPTEIEFSAGALAGSDSPMVDAIEPASAGLAPISPAAAGAPASERGRATLPPDVI
jgi:hypothetical protein